MTELVILPPLKAQLGSGGGYILTRKYMEGVAEFAARWPGRVTSLVEISADATDDMDHQEFFPDDPITPIEIRPSNLDQLAARLADAAVVFTFLSPFEHRLTKVCDQIGVPLVFWAEYSPQTELQIADAETPSLWRRWRKKRWLRKATRTRRAMVARAAGLQCSGLPVYDAYSADSRFAMVFWDNRVRSSEIVSELELSERATRLTKQRPLRLAFGGRLIAMKGVNYLPAFALALKQTGTPFTLDIYGSGPMTQFLDAEIQRLGLSEQVALNGALDFRTQWLPTLKDKVDLSICPHPQGDPSSTYPETMSCGLPMVGFDNEALCTIAETSGSGWTVPTGDIQALAHKVAALSNNRDEIVAHARRARDFASEHCFENTMDQRTEHLIAASKIAC